MNQTIRSQNPLPPAGQLAEDLASKSAGSDLKRGSWLPVDLAPYLDGTAQRQEPTVGIARTDGLRLLYAGKEHTVIGETESGKSFFAVACAAAELTAYQAEHGLSANRHVVYSHFEESDPTNTVNRLLDIGVGRIDIDENFHFIAPDVPITPDRHGEMILAIAERIKRNRIGPRIPPTLWIIDGLNECMALHGWDIRDESGVAAFRRTLIKPATRAGITTLICDHVVKDREKRGRTPLGSIHKLNGLDGAAFLLETKDPFGQGKRGAARLYVVKDRPGALRKHGVPDKSVPGKTYMGMQVVDSVTKDEFNPQGYVDVSIVAPDPEVPSVESKPSNDERVFSVTQKLIADNDGPVSTRSIRAHSGLRYQDTTDSLERLATVKRLIRLTGSRGASLWGLPADVLSGSGPDPLRGCPGTGPEPLN